MDSMTIDTKLYISGPAVLIEESWPRSPFAAVLLSAGYTPDLNHEVFASLVQFQVGTGIPITGKTVTRVGSVTRLSCNDFNFAAQGTLNAKFMAVVHSDGVLQDWNRCVALLDLNQGEDVELAITPAIQIDGQKGLIELELNNG